LGPPNAWEAELRDRVAAEPVFAVLSGIGGRNWAPVHQFCGHAGLPCLFPNVELPVVGESAFYSLYFSRGVLLEAALIAHQLQGQPHWMAVRRLVQVYRADDVGAAAAKTLAGELHRSGLEMVARVLKASEAVSGLASALEDVGPGDELVLWLRPKELAALGNHPANADGVWI